MPLITVCLQIHHPPFAAGQGPVIEMVCDHVLEGEEQDREGGLAAGAIAADEDVQFPRVQRLVTARS